MYPFDLEVTLTPRMLKGLHNLLIKSSSSTVNYFFNNSKFSSVLEHLKRNLIDKDSRTMLNNLIEVRTMKNQNLSSYRSKGSRNPVVSKRINASLIDDRALQNNDCDKNVIKKPTPIYSLKAVEDVKIVSVDAVHGVDNEKMFKDAIELYKRSCNQKTHDANKDVLTPPQIPINVQKFKNKNFDHRLLTDSNTVLHHKQETVSLQKELPFQSSQGFQPALKSSRRNSDLERDAQNVTDVEQRSENTTKASDDQIAGKGCLDSSYNEEIALPPWLNPDITNEDSGDLSDSVEDLQFLTAENNANAPSFDANGDVDDNVSKKLQEETVDTSGFSREKIHRDIIDFNAEELEKLNEGVTLSNKDQDKSDSGAVQDALYRDFLLNKKRSITTEMVNVERFFNVNQSEIATLVCGMLNSDDGGTIYLGVNTNSIIKGVKLDRKQRDKVNFNND